MVNIHQNNDYVCIRLGHEYYIHCPQGGSEPGLNSVDNLYIPTSSLAIGFSNLEDSGPSTETCFSERRACPQHAAFLSRRTCIAPSTYVYTSFVNDLVLAMSVAVGKTPRQTLWFDQLLYWPLACEVAIRFEAVRFVSACGKVTARGVWGYAPPPPKKKTKKNTVFGI